MTPSGRPLRFLGYVVGGWIGLRSASLLAPMMVNMLMPDAPATQIVVRPMRDGGGPAALGKPGTTEAMDRVEKIAATRSIPMEGGGLGPVPVAGRKRGNSAADLMPGLRVSLAPSHRIDGFAGRQDRGDDRRNPGPGALIAPRTSSIRRWSGTAWLLWRPQIDRGAINAPLLGGSQAGVRVDYRLTDGVISQLGLYGRVSRAFTGPSSEEAALGLAWRPSKLPVSLLVERRQRLGPGGRNGFAVLAAGGLGPRDVAPRIEVEGYAQSGFVGESLEQGFADGKASLAYRLTPAAERRNIALGASVSASVQPGAGRIDVGPEMRVRFPIGGATARLSAEWRARIAGKARPASGPAITLVADF